MANIEENAIFTVFVKSGEQLETFFVSSNDTVFTLKQFACQRFELPSSAIYTAKFMFAGQLLNNFSTLAASNVQKESTIQLVYSASNANSLHSDLIGWQWQLLGDIKVNRIGHACVEYFGHLVCVGGHNPFPSGSACSSQATYPITTVDVIELYTKRQYQLHTKTDTSELHPSKFEFRSFFAWAYDSSHHLLYVQGGQRAYAPLNFPRVLDGKSANLVENMSIWALDVSTMTWSCVFDPEVESASPDEQASGKAAADEEEDHEVDNSNLPLPCSGASMTLVGRRLFIYGGTLADGTVSNQFHIFNLDTNRYEKLPSYFVDLPASTQHCALYRPHKEQLMFFHGRFDDLIDSTRSEFIVMDTHVPPPTSSSSSSTSSSSYLSWHLASLDVIGVPRLRFGSAAVVLNDELGILTHGGVTNKNSPCDSYVLMNNPSSSLDLSSSSTPSSFKPESLYWHNLTAVSAGAANASDMILSRHGHHMLVLPDLSPSSSSSSSSSSMVVMVGGASYDGSAAAPVLIMRADWNTPLPERKLPSSSDLYTVVKASCQALGRDELDAASVIGRLKEHRITELQLLNLEYSDVQSLEIPLRLFMLMKEQTMSVRAQMAPMTDKVKKGLLIRIAGGLYIPPASASKKTSTSSSRPAPGPKPIGMHDESDESKSSSPSVAASAAASAPAGKRAAFKKKYSDHDDEDFDEDDDEVEVGDWVIAPAAKSKAKPLPKPNKAKAPLPVGMNQEPNGNRLAAGAGARLLNPRAAVDALNQMGAGRLPHLRQQLPLRR